MGECVANGHSEIERFMEIEENRLSEIIEKDAELGSTAILGLRDTFANYRIRDSRSAASVAGSVLLGIAATLSRLFPEIGTEGIPKRWPRGSLVYAKGRIAEFASATAVLYAPCSLDERLGGLFELHFELSEMSICLSESAYDDQFSECQMAVADEQRRLTDAQLRIAESTEAQSAKMTRMTKVVMVATVVMLAASVSSCAASLDDSHDGRVALIGESVEALSGSVNSIDERLQGLSL